MSQATTPTTHTSKNVIHNEYNNTGTNITFQDLKYSVPGSSSSGKGGKGDGGTVEILQGLTGCFLPGKLSALMGKSGSGKTTLLDVVAGRKNAGTTTGQLLYNGRVPTLDAFRSTVGYVEQFDTLVAELTVQQMLQYTAELKLPRSTTTVERKARVEEVVQMLDLESCRNVVIGNALRRGISGGQAKRVNIGLALIPRPPILLLDEPTSGLDSKAANQVVQLLRQLAHHQGQQRTIVCTIHAPSGHAFDLFDDLYLIHQGKTLYHGPLHRVQDYFETLGHSRDQVASLPEWLVDLTSGTDLTPKLATNHGIPAEKNHKDDGHDHESGQGKTVYDFVAAYQISELRTQMEQQLQQILKTQQQQQQQQEHDQQTNGSSHGKQQQSSFWEHHDPPSEVSKLCTVLKYRSLARYTDPEFMLPRFGDKTLFALLFMSLYWDLGNKTDPRSVASIVSLFFFIAAKCGFGAASFVPALTLERSLYYRELADGCYAPITYYFAKFLEEAIIALFTSFVFTILVFFGCGLSGSFGIFFTAYYLTTLVGVILAYAFAAYFSSLSSANAWLPTYVTVNLYFSGFVILFEKIPQGWRWFGWTSFMRYSWGAMMVDNFQNSEPGRALVFFDEDGSPQTVLEFYGMVDDPILANSGACLGLLTTILVFFTVLGVLSLAYIRHDKR